MEFVHAEARKTLREENPTIITASAREDGCVELREQILSLLRDGQSLELKLQSITAVVDEPFPGKTDVCIPGWGA